MSTWSSPAFSRSAAPSISTLATAFRIPHQVFASEPALQGGGVNLPSFFRSRFGFSSLSPGRADRKLMTVEHEEQRRAAWVRPHMEWAAVENAKARLSGSADSVPRTIENINLTHLSHQFYAWWLEARGTRVMPAPEDVSPRALVELLPYLRYLSWEENDRLVFRIYGSALAEATGLD